MGLLFTIMLTLAAMGYGWINPVFGLLVYYCFAVLRPPHLWWWSVGTTGSRYLMLVAAATLIGWALKGLGDWSRIKYVKWPLLGLVAYLASGLFATELIAVDKRIAWEYLEPQLKTGVIVLIALTLFTTSKNVRLFAWVVTLSFGYLALNLNQQYLSFNSFLLLRGFGGIDNNGAAMIMVIGFPLTLFMGLQVKSWGMKAVCFFSALCLIHVVLFSYSRGGQLGLIITGFMTFVAILIVLPRKGLTMIIGIVVVILSLAMAGEPVRKEFWSIFADKQERDESAASRFDTWAAGWACMKANPLGVGPRNFNRVAHVYGLSHGKSIHNLYLQTGADYGFIGAFGLILFYFGTAAQCFKMSFSPTARRLGWPRHFGQMVSISMAGFAICSVFIGMETVEHGFIVATLGMCSVAYVRNLETTELEFSNQPVPELEQVPSASYDQHMPELA